MARSGGGEAVGVDEQAFDRNDLQAIFAVLFDMKALLIRIARALEGDDEEEEEEDV